MALLPTDSQRLAASAGEPWTALPLHVLRGFMIGGADIIPGISGGTVALVLGIYGRLVTAISRVDLEFFQLVRRRDVVGAARHIDLAFLLSLLVGIAAGILSLAGVMHFLITDPVARPLTLAALFGLIFGSCLLLARLVHWTPSLAALSLASAAGAFGIVGLQGEQVDPSLPYVFFCGMIAISAMILPGISGAFILVLLGAYVPVTGALKELPPRGPWVWDNVLLVAVFCSGCVVGLLVICKVLRWLLTHHGDLALAVLGGFILGSLRKVWPYQRELEAMTGPGAGAGLWEGATGLGGSSAVSTAQEKQYELFLPQQFDGQAALITLIVVAATLLVVGLDQLSRRRAARQACETVAP